MFLQEGIARRTLLRAAAFGSVSALVASRLPSPCTQECSREASRLRERNLGLITADLPDVSSETNHLRHLEMIADVHRHVGWITVRGIVRSSSGSSIRRALLLVGDDVDNGSLKGLLRKIGLKFAQEFVVHKPYRATARLYSLGAMRKSRAERDLGEFSPSALSSYLDLITYRNEPMGRWQNIALWTRESAIYGRAPPRQLRL